MTRIRLADGSRAALEFAADGLALAYHPATGKTLRVHGGFVTASFSGDSLRWTLGTLVLSGTWGPGTPRGEIVYADPLSEEEGEEYRPPPEIREQLEEVLQRLNALV